MKILLSPYHKNGLTLSNHTVMAPMTRNRALGNIPNELMAEYYEQRASAGLIITEGTSPAPEGLGYVRIPGIFSQEQVEGWKLVTQRVHAKGGKIFVQFMHSGRIGNLLNLPEGINLIGVSDLQQPGQIHTEEQGMQDHSEPLALSTEGVKRLVKQFVKAAENAVAAGFDGVELHSAHGYLLEQFLNPNINNRTDEYGGNITNRSKVIIEIVEATVKAIGKERTAIRISPFATTNDMPPYEEEEVHNTYVHLAKELNRIGIVYLHHSLNPFLPEQTRTAIREAFTGTLILSNGQTIETAEALLQSGAADLVAFGKPFLANPDLVERFALNAPLNSPNYKTVYGRGKEGYTDYPVLDNYQENIKA